MQLKWPMLWNFFSLFPAYAGVIPVVSFEDLVEITLPRIRGGDPLWPHTTAVIPISSPHTRG